jgi:hypothetical protein
MRNLHGNHEILPFVAGKLAFLNPLNKSGFRYAKRLAMGCARRVLSAAFALHGGK